MLARSLSNRGGAFCMLLAFVAAPRCFADGVQAADPLLRYRTTGGMQGMYEVREAARKFLARQAPPPEGAWVASMPDVRIFVPTCAVPFKTRWAVESDNEAGMPGVMVICPKSTDRTFKKWDAFVGADASHKSGTKK